MIHARRCGRCGDPLQGLRSDARWCGSTCRVLAYRERRLDRIVRAAVAEAGARVAAAWSGRQDDD